MMKKSFSFKDKPPLPWIEGMLDYFNIPFPHEENDPRRLGFSIGQQIIGLYIVEMLLKYALDKYKTSYNRHHNLLALFVKLPPSDRNKVEAKYKEILSNRVSETWDVAKTVESLLGYYGKSAITDTRYFWEKSSRTIPRKGASIVIGPATINPLIYSIFISLHGYPSQRLTVNYKTKFVPLVDNDP